MAETGAAVANFYLEVVRNGLVNAQSITLAKLSFPPPLAFDVKPSITIPILKGRRGRLRGDLKVHESSPTRPRPR